MAQLNAKKYIELLMEQKREICDYHRQNKAAKQNKAA